MNLRTKESLSWIIVCILLGGLMYRISTVDVESTVQMAQVQGLLTGFLLGAFFSFWSIILFGLFSQRRKEKAREAERKAASIELATSLRKMPSAQNLRKWPKKNQSHTVH